MVSYLPVGSEEATKWYAEQALRAGVGFVNAIPVFIGREPYWQRRFAEEGLPVIGDDIKSQVGATISHRVLTRLFMDRGVRLDRTYQLNFGGNTDFLNMLERERLESKKISKTNAVTSHARLRARPRRRPRRPVATTCRGCSTASGATSGWRARPSATCRSTPSSSSRSGTAPTAPGVITDAIRCLKLGLDRGLKGTLVAPSAYFMKSPPRQIHDDIAFNRVEAFIRGDDTETLVGTEKPADAQAPQAGRRARPRSRPPRRRDRQATATAGSAAASASAGRSDAPVRRAPPRGAASARRRAAPRVVERVGRRSATGRRRGCWPTLPPKPAAAVIGRLSQLSYLAWPTKRRWSNRNFGHVLGLPPDHRGSARVALARVRGYGRYLVELMRLPRCRPRSSPRSCRTSTPTRSGASGARRRRRRADPRGRARRQQRGRRGGDRPPRACRSASSPTTPSFPELFEILRRQREALGRQDHRRGATCARSSACCAAARCSACSSTGATAPTASRSACSARGRRCPPGRRRSPPRPARDPAGRRSGASPTTRSTSSWPEPIEVAVVATRPSSSARPRRWPTRSRR